ncbi:MAG: putative DNA binding domain-containing protein [Crocinitomicaceae bacterium]|nr:putative DNA binding domain-containing protein [Crocinitomicaceae bacterium]
MALPINIEELVHGNTIEWERLELKKGWNPENVIHSMCAFANDLHNWGGGYIIVGVEENEGLPILPPFGLQEDQIDSIQKNILTLGHQIQPNYFPIVQPFKLEEKQILVLWCPAGDNPIYTAPSSLGNNGGTREAYVRVGSNSIIAKGETLRRLQELTARIPFDDRINNQASIQDLDLGLIQAYLQEVKSGLYEESKTMSFEDLCRTMLIARGSNENVRPVNVGLLFFCKQPERFFNRAWIELVWHKDNSSTNYKEYYFKGPLQKQLRDTLSFLQTNLISEEVIKSANKAEADRFYNFPYAALEEALSNAVYHKSYEMVSPIEIQIWPDKIEILSYPGPLPPVNSTIMKTQRRIVAREYRNRRIGDFLKELHLTEGRGTGFPTIYNAMAENGSPTPSLETDENSPHVLVVLPGHNGISIGASNGVKLHIFNNLQEIIDYSNGTSNGASNGAGTSAISIISNNIHDRVSEMLEILETRLKRAELFEKMNLSNQSKNRFRYLDPLIENGWVAAEFPDEKTHPNQTYVITTSGERLFKLLTRN